MRKHFARFVILLVIGFILMNLVDYLDNRFGTDSPWMIAFVGMFVIALVMIVVMGVTRNERRKP